MNKFKACCITAATTLVGVGIYMNTIGVPPVCASIDSSWNKILYNGREYRVHPCPPVPFFTRKHRMGRAQSREKNFKIYSIEDNPDFIYCKCNGRGNYYKIQPEEEMEDNIFV